MPAERDLQDLAWLLHGFASHCFPPFSLIISQNKPVLSNSFASAATILFSVFVFSQCCVSTGQTLTPLVQLLSLHWNTTFSIKPFLIPRQMSRPFLPGALLYLVLISSITISIFYGLQMFFLPKFNSLRTGAHSVLFELINQEDIVNKNKMYLLGIGLLQSEAMVQRLANYGPLVFCLCL